MTAIGIAYTANTFAVAADGRGLSNVNPRHTSDAARKIFEAAGPERVYAYALTGSIITEDKSFNLVLESDAVVKSLSNRSFDMPSAYLTAVASGLAASIEAAKHKEPVPGGCLVFARIIFAGFFKRSPSIMSIEFMTRSEAPSLADWTPNPGDYRLSGPDKFTQLFVERRGSAINGQSTADEGAAFVRGYIEACADANAVAIDPECANVGGHIHIAEVAPSNFSWRIPPFNCGRL